jgi:hypothetical protein
MTYVSKWDLIREYAKKYGEVASDNREELKLMVSRAIVNSLGLRKGTNYKKKIPLMNLIDDKISNEDKRFQQYVVITHKIDEYLTDRFPFLDLENIDLNWTGEELIDECVRQYDVHMERVSKLPKIELQIPERLQEKEN